MTGQIFVSHSRADSTLVGALVADLRGLGLDPFVDTGLTGGQRYWDTVLDRIAACEIFIPVVSPGFLESEACYRQTAWADSCGLAFMSIDVGGVDRSSCPPAVADADWLHYDPAEATALEQLAHALRGAQPGPRSATPERPPIPLAYSVELEQEIAGQISWERQLAIIQGLHGRLGTREDATARRLLADLQRNEVTSLDSRREIEALLRAPAATTADSVSRADEPDGAEDDIEELSDQTQPLDFEPVDEGAFVPPVPPGPVWDPAVADTEPSGVRRPRRRVLVLAAAFLLLVTGGLATWLVVRDRAADAAAAKRVASKLAELGQATWAGADARACASSRFVEARGLRRLESTGLVDGSGQVRPDAWTSDTATAWYADLLACDDNWAVATAEAQGGDPADASCFAGAGADAVAHALGAELAAQEDDASGSTVQDLLQCRQPAVEQLRKVSDRNRASLIDFEGPSGLLMARPDFYEIGVADTTERASAGEVLVQLPSNDGPFSVRVTPVWALDGVAVRGAAAVLDDLEPWGPPPPPTGSGAAAYRSVVFSVQAGSSPGHRTYVEARHCATCNWVPASKQPTSRLTKPTPSGGVRACVDVRSVAVGEGNVKQTSAPVNLCGTAQPRRVYWTRSATCDWRPGCSEYELHVEGFVSGAEVTISYYENGGYCGEDTCVDTASVDEDGRAWITNWSFTADYNSTWTAVVNGVSASLNF